VNHLNLNNIMAPPLVCVVGSANVDLTVFTPRLPRPGETLAGRHFHLGFGGKGANQAVMAARLGARVTLIARVGGDVFGRHMLANLKDQNIDTAHIRLDQDQPTGVASIIVDDAAQNCILVVPGANGFLSPEDIRQSASAIQRANVLLCQLEVPIPTILEAFRLARAAGVMTILNPAPAMTLPDELLALADLCVPNETELELLTGQTLGTLEEIEAAGQALLKRGPKTVLVTLGNRGALLVSKDGRAQHFPALPVTAVDPTGAGDAFIGSLAVFLTEGMPLSEAIAKANRVAGLSVTRKGTQTAFPTRAEI
jgi:ribokinase